MERSQLCRRSHRFCIGTSGSYRSSAWKEQQIVGTRLVHLIEKHSEELAIGLTDKLRLSERTSDFRKIPAAELQNTAAGLYHNLGEWLLKKTEKDIEAHFVSIAKRRAADGIGLQQLVWALILSRNHLYRFLLGSAFADSIFELYSELELQQLVSQFFERAIYYSAAGYEEARERDRAKATATSAGQIRHAGRLRKVISRVVISR
jgi:hypothetical protein